MKTLVYGLGESGVAATRALLARGEKVVVADSSDSDRLRQTLRDLGVEGYLRAGPEILENGFDRLVASPLVRPHNPVLLAAEARRIPVVSEVSLGLDLLRAEAPEATVAAVTGTNGKTTVVGMLDKILSTSGILHTVAGNSWRALTGCLEEAKKSQLLVLELSSFQLHYVNKPRFDIAALLNVRPDHLNWHASFKEYKRDKLRIFEGQRAGDLSLVSVCDPVGLGFLEEATGDTLVIGEGGTSVQDQRLVLRGAPVAALDELPFLGAHNYENALFAAAAAQRLGVALADVSHGLSKFQLKPHRMQIVARDAGVTYVDDSKATNPAATAAALASFAAPTILLLGGSEKDTDFAEILTGLSHCRSVICQGEAGPRIASYLQTAGVKPEVRLVRDLVSAVAEAQKVAHPGDVVLLSPGCASFDQFPGYAERGVAFAGLVSAGGNR